MTKTRSKPIPTASARTNPQSGQQVQMRMVAYQGPLPDPNMLAAYNQVLPGLANRLVGMAEKEQSHRHQREKLPIHYAGAISICFIVAALIASIYSPFGALLGLGALAPLIARFLERKEK